MPNLKKTLGITTSLLFCTSLAFSASDDSALKQAQYSKQDVDSIENIVHDYILNNPAIIEQAMVKLQQQKQEEREQLAQKAIKTNQAELFKSTTSPTLGNNKADVILVEFFDYQCGYCKKMTPIIKDLLATNDNLKVVMKEMPIFGGTSLEAAKAALGVFQISPESYIKFHTSLIDAKGKLTKDSIFKAAKDANISKKKLEKAMADMDTQNELKATKDLAAALNISGTPAFVLTNASFTQFKFIGGATSKEALQKIITKLEKN